jgi:hypothetical protein
MKLGSFFDNPQIGKTARQLDTELREVAAETRRRVNNNCDTEDQQWRTHFLRDARGQVN